MRVSKEKAAENRGALLEAASKLFRAKGIDGVGVADVSKAAGLTHGALYAHFPSKEALAAEAFSHGFAGSMAAIRAWAGDRNPSFEDWLNVLFSDGMRDRLETGCPMTASASEAARQGNAVGNSFARAFEEEVRVIERALSDRVPGAKKRQIAIACVASQIGAIAVARAVVGTSPALSEQVLQSVRDTIASAVGSTTEPPASRSRLVAKKARRQGVAERARSDDAALEKS